jgi:hypothetical protein
MRILYLLKHLGRLNESRRGPYWYNGKYDPFEVSEKTICAFVVAAENEREAREIAMNVALSEEQKEKDLRELRSGTWGKDEWATCEVVGQTESRISGIVGIVFGCKKEKQAARP